MRVTNKSSLNLLLRPQSTAFGRSFSTDNRTLEQNLKVKYDESQVDQLGDSLTQIDENDQVIGPVSKLHGHLKPDGKPVQLAHRAFSLFLFNARNELLMTQRSAKKITFPNMWTNTCCSHPRHTADEMDLSEGYVGPRRASVRRTEFELGIKDLQVDQIYCGAKILYYADACDTFAEHELDYILFAKVDNLADYEVNVDEVKDSEWVGRSDLDAFLNERHAKNGDEITPWFALLKERKLDAWWREIEKSGTFPD